MESGRVIMGEQRHGRTIKTSHPGRAPHGLRVVLLAVVAMSIWASVLPGLTALPSAGAQVDPEPRPLPGPALVSITAAGYEPSSVTVAEGQSIVFTNESTVDQTVTEAAGLFDSGAIPPGGAFSLALDEPGFHSFATTTPPGFLGALSVGPLDIAGPSNDLVRAHLPEIAIPPVTDWDELPGRGILTSRTRLMVMFADSTTVAQANTALAAADVTVVGTIPAINTVLTVAEDRGPGDFDATFTAEATLLADPAVEAAALDFAQTTEAVPGVAEDGLIAGGTANPTAWLWGDQREPDGSGKGDGGNWGMEAARFPQAWNLLDPVRRAGAEIDTLVLDIGFADHVDLPMIPRAPLCYAGQCNADRVVDATHYHATHVSGIIGATWANPLSDQQPQMRGVDGANPVVRLFGAPAGVVGPWSQYPATANQSQAVAASMAVHSSTFTQAIAGKTEGRWPQLRVMNMSLGTLVYTRDAAGYVQWGSLQGARRCGPGSFDDGPAATGPCLPSTDDVVRREIHYQGVMAQALATLARQQDVVIVVAAGNESGKICVGPGGAVAKPTSAGCAAGYSFNREDARTIQMWGSTASALGPGDANPFILVGAHDINHNQAGFSNTGADVFAPGVGILSTAFANGYELQGGTSMAAPHVTGLVGYLLQINPNLTPSQIRHLLRDYGVVDVGSGGGSTPRIDAFNAVMGLDTGPTLMVDVNDASTDGNRRVRRTRGGTEAPDTDLGPTIGGKQVHSTGDLKVDMRDFRRYRDALLAACADASHPSPSSTVCPTPDQIDLDGAVNHLKKDLNLDGCVYNPSIGVCVQPEDRFSRFDFNGDGSLVLDHLARLPITGTGAHGTAPAATLATGEEFSDLTLLQQLFEADSSSTEGWRADQLRDLLVSGDVEVHADAMFNTGAAYVDVVATYGNGQTSPVQRVSRAGDQVVVTVPVARAGEVVSVSGTGYRTDGTVQNQSYVESPALKPGSDRRADLCVATVRAVPTVPGLFADGESSTEVSLTVENCGRPLGEGIPLEHELIRQDGNGTAVATVSAPTSVTDANGRSTVTIHAGATAEDLRFVVTASVETDPGHAGPEEVTQTVDIDVTPPPRVIYKWEQITDDWRSHRHVPGLYSGSNETEFSPSTANPLVLGRSGSLTATADGGVRYTEHVGPNPIDAHLDIVDTETGESESLDTSFFIPRSQRVPDRTGLMSGITTNLWTDDGEYRPIPEREYSQAAMTVEDDQVTVEGFNDMGHLSYRYDDVERECTIAFTLWCAYPAEWDQIALVGRAQGSAIAYADDLTKDLSFRRLPNGSFSTHHWCSAPKDFEMRGLRLPELTLYEGSVTGSRFRFIATVTTDPDMKGEDLVLPENCVAPVAPVASFTRDIDSPVEGRVVKFLDTSADANGDVATWAWDFGDGTTSTDQDPEHRFEDDGTYRVTLTVTDGTGLTSTTASDVVVVNGAPEVSADDVTVDAGDPVVVQLRLFDPSERDQEYLDLQVAWEDRQAPLYPAVRTPGGALSLNLGVLPEGQRDLRLTVKDKDGKEATVVITVTVGDGAERPEAPAELESPPAPGCGYGVKLDEREQDLLDQVSGYRIANGRDPVFPSPTLTAAATAQARWLRDNDMFQHEGEGGSTPLARAIAAGYPAGTVGENLARGPGDAYGALVAWKMSSGHDANLLARGWGGVGIAAVDTEHGTLWVVVFGDRLDCPTGPPDFDPATDPPDPVVEPDGPVVTEVLASSQSVAPATGPDAADGSTPVEGPAPEAAARPIDLVPTAPTSGPAPEGAPMPPARNPDDPATASADPTPAAAEPSPTVVAFTLSSASVATGEVVTVTNRSSATAGIEPGDGRPRAPLAVGAAMDLDYLDPGTFAVLAALGSTRAVADLAVSGTPRPPTITYTGPTGAAFGARPVLTASLTTGTGTPVVGREVRFTIDGRELTATTDATGVASATLIADLAPGPHPLLVAAPPLESGPGASTSVTFTIGVNAPPIAEANGPYEVVLGEALHLDPTGSSDPDGAPLASIRWDLDDDGAFDDASGTRVIPPADVASVVCGGTCDPATPDAIALEVTDAAGAVAVVETEVRSMRDFTLSLTPASATLNPGGATSFQVRVTTSSGFADPVQLSAPSLPPGVTATFQPPSVVAGGTSVLTLIAALDVQAYDGEFLIRGTSGSLVKENPGTVEVEFGLIPLCFGAADVFVFDVATGEPIAGAIVDFSYTTDADGMVRITDLPLGRNNSPVSRGFSAAGDEHGYQRTDQVLGCGVVNQVELGLTRYQYGRLDGRLVVGIPDPNDHRPTRAVTPTQIPLPGNVAIGSSYSAAVGADGRFAFEHLRLPFHNTLLATSPGYGLDPQGVAVTTEGTTVMTQALVPLCTGEVDVRVRDGRTHLPLVGARVSVDGVVTGTASVTGPGGRLRVTGVPLGPRNSTLDVGVRIRVQVAAVDLVANTRVTLTDCGSIAVADLEVTPPTANYGNLEGRVTNSLTGDPAAGIVVRYSSPGLAGRVTTTDGEGRYRFADIFVGNDGTTFANGTVIADPQNQVDFLSPTFVAVRVDANATATKDLTLTPRQFAAIDIRAVDAATGEPLAGITIRQGGLTDRQTDADGYVRNERIPTDNQPLFYGASAWAPGFLPANGSIILQPAGRGYLELPMTRECAPARVQGLVRDASTGLPLPGARVSLSNMSNDQFTGADGRFLFPAVPVTERRPTTYRISAGAPGYQPASKTVSLFCGGSITVEIGAPNTGAGSLTGRVTRADTGGPAAGVVVSGEWGALTTTDSNGTYAFASVPLDGATGSRDWSVSFVPPYTSGLEGTSRTATILVGQPTTLDVVLGGPRPNERPVAQAIEVTLPEGQSEVTVTMAATDADGDPLTYRIASRPDSVSANQSYPSPIVALRLNDPNMAEARVTYVASDGRLDSVPAEIIVRRNVAPPVNRPPSAFILPVAVVSEGSVVHLDGTLSSDPDGTIAAYDWDLDGDGAYDDASGAKVDMAVPESGRFFPALRVTDNGGATGTAIQQVTVRNVAPVVDAGGDETLGGDRLQRAGSFTDPGADTWTAKVDWGSGGGKEPLALTGTTFALDHAYDSAGTFTVSVEVCDDDLGCGTDTLSVVVPAPPDNDAPVAVIAEPGSAVEGSTVALDGSGSSDADGSISGFAWDLDGDGQFDDAVGATPSLPVVDDATIVIGLEVTDDDGATATASAVLTVTNVVPVVDAGDDATIGADRRLQRPATFVDPGADIWMATVDWDDGAGPQPVGLLGSAIAIDHTYPTGGSFTVTVRVCDDDEGCGLDTFTVTVPVPPPNVAPIAVVDGPASVREGSTVTLDATDSSDSDGVVVAHEWDLDGDGDYDDATGATVGVDAPDDGVRTVGLRVRDDDGATGESAATFTITNVAPAVDAGGDVTLERGQAFGRSGSFGDPGADTWVGSIDWGEGAGPQLLGLTPGGFRLERTFAAAGTFDVEVRVCDDDQGCGTDRFTVTVTEPPADPVADVSIAKSHIGDLVPGGQVTYTLAAANAGPDVATGPVIVIDTLPAGLSFVSATGTGWSCGATGQVVTCTSVDALTVGVAPPVELVAAIASTVAPGTNVVNTATVDAATPDPDLDDNDASDEATVASVVVTADLGVALAGPTTLDAGAAGAWRASVHNVGPDDADAVEVTITFPTGFVNVGASGPGWTCVGTGPVTCVTPSIASGATTALDLTATAGSSAVATNAVSSLLEVTVRAAATDPDPSNDHAELDLVVVAPPVPTSTTTTSTTTTVPSSTTTTARGSSTSTTDAPSSTSAAPTSVAPTSTDGAVAATSTTTGSLPATGSSPLAALAAAAMAIVIGSALALLHRRRVTRT